MKGLNWRFELRIQVDRRPSGLLVPTRVLDFPERIRRLRPTQRILAPDFGRRTPAGIILPAGVSDSSLRPAMYDWRPSLMDHCVQEFRCQHLGDWDIGEVIIRKPEPTVAPSILKARESNPYFGTMDPGPHDRLNFFNAFVFQRGRPVGQFRRSVEATKLREKLGLREPEREPSINAEFWGMEVSGGPGCGERRITVPFRTGLSRIGRNLSG